MIFDSKFILDNLTEVVIIGLTAVGLIIVMLSFKIKFAKAATIFGIALLGLILVGGARSFAEGGWGADVANSLLP